MGHHKDNKRARSPTPSDSDDSDIPAWMMNVGSTHEQKKKRKAVLHDGKDNHHDKSKKHKHHHRHHHHHHHSSKSSSTDSHDQHRHHCSKSSDSLSPKSKHLNGDASQSRPEPLHLSPKSEPLISPRTVISAAPTPTVGPQLPSDKHLGSPITHPATNSSKDVSSPRFVGPSLPPNFETQRAHDMTEIRL